MKFFICIFLVLLSISIAKCTNNSKSNTMVSKAKAITIDTLNCAMFEGNWKIGNGICTNSESYGAGNAFRFDSICGYTTKLDVNFCGARFEIFDDKSIKFYSPTCTEQCCDTDFSMYGLGLLTSVNQVTFINSDTICLSGTITKGFSTNGFLTNTSMEDSILKLTLIKQDSE